MKKILTLAIVLMALATRAQQDPEVKPSVKTFSAVPQLRIYGFYPIHFGDSQFSEAYQAKPAFGFNLSPVRYKSWRLNLGVERAVYEVDDPARIALPVRRSAYHSVFAEIQYTIGREDGFCLKPSVGAGGSILYFNNGFNDRFGKQEGTDLRAGLTADWAIFKHFSLFLTAHYVRSNIDVDTSQEFRDFYSKANSVQVGMGIVIR